MFSVEKRFILYDNKIQFQSYDIFVVISYEIYKTCRFINFIWSGISCKIRYLLNMKPALNRYLSRKLDTIKDFFFFLLFWTTHQRTTVLEIRSSRGLAAVDEGRKKYIFCLPGSYKRVSA